MVLIGGGSKVQGLSQRLHRDLTTESPAGSAINIKVGKGGSEGAYLAMQNIARDQSELFNVLSVKKDEYFSQGNSVFTPNPWSNPAL